MKNKLFVGFICISIFLIIYFAVSYYNKPFKIPDDINAIRIVDCRTNQEIIVKDNIKIREIVDKINGTKKEKSNLTEIPNGPAYALTFLDNKNKEISVISIFDMNDYYLLTFKSSFKNYTYSTVDKNSDLLNTVDEVYKSIE